LHPNSKQTYCTRQNRCAIFAAGILFQGNTGPYPVYDAVKKAAPTPKRLHNQTGKREKIMKEDSPPLKPTALGSFKNVDPEIGQMTAGFWKKVWGNENPAIDQKTKYLLSLANAVGSGRYRQAARELIKAYAAGTTAAELDELFTLLIWNQGMGHFASEVASSPLFAIYQFIKSEEAKGGARKEIVDKILSRFGEGNPEVSALPKNFKD
jgi:alkylhydroperoxidase/carboxymuconolactone decarboxylase family protein YurZ